MGVLGSRTELNRTFSQMPITSPASGRMSPGIIPNWSIMYRVTTVTPAESYWLKLRPSTISMPMTSMNCGSTPIKNIWMFSPLYSMPCVL